MSKLFSFAGTCVVEGATVYKFANDANRAAVLTKLGATDVNIIQLPFAMGKEEAVEWLNGQGITATKAPRVAKVAKVKAPKIAKNATVTVKVKRVGDAPRKGQDPDQFTKQWFAKQEALVGDRFNAKTAA